MIFVYLAIIILLIFLLVGIAIFSVLSVLDIFTTDAPFVPIPSKIEENIVKELKLQQGSILYDLGCGDARLLIKAMDMHPDISAIGIEIGIFPYLLAKLKTAKYKNKARYITIPVG